MRRADIKPASGGKSVYWTVTFTDTADWLIISVTTDWRRKVEKVCCCCLLVGALIVEHALVWGEKHQASLTRFISFFIDTSDAQATTLLTYRHGVHLSSSALGDNDNIALKNADPTSGLLLKNQNYNNYGNWKSKIPRVKVSSINTYIHQDSSEKKWTHTKEASKTTQQLQLLTESTNKFYKTSWIKKVVTIFYSYTNIIHDTIAYL